MQQKQPFIIPALLSLLLAVCTLLAIEYLDIIDGILNHYLGPASNMKQLQHAGGGSFYKGVEMVMASLLIIFVLYAVLYFAFFECFALLYFFITSRWFNPEVFISYKNTEEDSKADTTKIALAIKKALELKGFKVHFFEYTKTMRHDIINNEIKSMLRKAHAMVVIPDPYHPSYVDTEIQCAAYDEKPVFIIKHTKDQKLPNTANSGHTVLLLDKLRKEKFKPLVYLLQYVHKNWHTRLFIPGKPFEYFLEAVVNIIEGIKTYAWALAGFVLTVILLAYFAVPVVVVSTVLKLVVTCIGIAAAFATIKSIMQNTRLQKTIRQSILSSGNTYELYKETSFAKNILGSIDKVGLINEHIE